jgi:hypothetical protein
MTPTKSCTVIDFGAMPFPWGMLSDEAIREELDFAKEVQRHVAIGSLTHEAISEFIQSGYRVLFGME